jgi:hypothetical protein
VALPFAGAVQGTHDAPQLAGEVSATQAPKQACVPASHDPAPPPVPPLVAGPPQLADSTTPTTAANHRARRSILM